MTEKCRITEDYEIHCLKGPRFLKTACLGNRVDIDIFYGAKLRAIRLVLENDTLFYTLWYVSLYTQIEQGLASWLLGEAFYHL